MNKNIIVGEYFVLIALMINPIFAPRKKKNVSEVSVTYQKNKIIGTFLGNPFEITKIDKNQFELKGKKITRLTSKIRKFITYENCKKKKIEYVLDEYNNGKLHIGNSDKIVSNSAQALAIAIAEAKRYC